MRSLSGGVVLRRRVDPDGLRECGRLGWVGPEAVLALRLEKSRVLLAEIQKDLEALRGGGSDQYLSWIHEHDLVRAVEFLLERDDLDGAVNLAAPGPLPQAEFARILRRAWGRRLGLPATEWMLAIGAFVLRSDTELLLKSRRVVPGRLLEAGFTFEFPEWEGAARELVERVREGRAA